MPAQTRAGGAKPQAPAKEEDKKPKQKTTKSKPVDPDQMDVDSDHNTRKRKEPPTNTKSSQPDTKSAKKISTKKEDANKGTSSVTPGQLVNFLLSSSSLPLCYPSDELTANKKGSFPKTYSMTPPSSFTPFEHLVTAHLLSKPLSHTLGMRSIRTLLNPPYDFTTAQKMHDAGEKKVWQALEDAKTQHRQKTASYLAQMAETYTDDETMFKLAEEANEGGSKSVVSHITDTVNGMGPMGAQLFCRRIQCVDGWGEAVWPFIDDKCHEALGKLGIEVKDAAELRDLVKKEVDYETVGQMGLEKLVATGRERDDGDGKVKDMNEEQRVQVEFVVLLERAIGAVLEGNVEEVRRKAAE